VHSIFRRRIGFAWVEKSASVALAEPTYRILDYPHKRIRLASIHVSSVELRLHRRDVVPKRCLKARSVEQDGGRRRAMTDDDAAVLPTKRQIELCGALVGNKRWIMQLHCGGTRPPASCTRLTKSNEGRSGRWPRNIVAFIENRHVEQRDD
jgi:hypothetical protein